jgi:hypothetical protein
MVLKMAAYNGICAGNPFVHQTGLAAVLVLTELPEPLMMNN